MILDDIKNYPKQFEYEPKVENAEKLKKAGLTVGPITGPWAYQIGKQYKKKFRHVLSSS